jgi:Raf kinase inhibitor-like YbhB/YbcL family protein
VFAIALGLGVLGGCRPEPVQPSSPNGGKIESMAVTSKTFASNDAIPVDNTCDGADRSPDITWSAPPAGTKSFAIVAEDPDAPGGTFTHWIAYNIDSAARDLPEGADPATLGGAAGLNDFKHPAYNGPCPPKSEIHHYVFRVFALDQPVEIRPEPDRDAIDTAMGGHVLGVGAVVGSFSH